MKSLTEKIKNQPNFLSFVVSQLLHYQNPKLNAKNVIPLYRSETEKQPGFPNPR